MDLEQTDDLKLAVTEACSFLLEHSKRGDSISVSFEGCSESLKVTVQVTGHDSDDTEALNLDTDDLGLFLMHALMDEVEARDQGRTLVMSKRLARRIDE